MFKDEIEKNIKHPIFIFKKTNSSDLKSTN